MSTKAMRSGEPARAPTQQGSGKDPKPKVPKQLIERIKEATNATDEVIIHTLEECNYDPNEATTRLIDSKRAVRYLLLAKSRPASELIVRLLQTRSWSLPQKLNGSSR